MAAEGQPLGWGVIGATSTVAQLAVLPALARSPEARLVALASQSVEPQRLPDFGAARVLPTYQAVLEDPEVEAVYVPLPNALHAEWTLRAAAAGRHVLCEKPLAPDQVQAQAMADACREAGVVLMEAYMTAFHARTRAWVEVAGSGRLGRLCFVHGAFTGVLSGADDHRWDPAMGGGALLDVGIYCLAPMLAAAGRPPRAVAGAAAVAATGVDSSFSGWLDFGHGLAGAIECSFEAPERQRLELVGTEAALVAERAFTPGPGDDQLHLRHRDGTIEALTTGADDAYQVMVEHFAAVVRGHCPSYRPVSDSVALAGVLDQLAAAAQLGPRR